MIALQMALDSILEKKSRSFLTMIGIIIGVCAVLILVSMVSGYNQNLMAYYEKMGVNKITVDLSFYQSDSAPDLSQTLYDYGNGDLKDYVTGVTPLYTTSGTLKFRTASEDTATVYLAGDQFASCYNYTLEKGRDLTAFDMENRNAVCVIGSYTAKTLFGLVSPLGETLYFNGDPYTVVGTYYQKDGGEEDSMDDMVVLPYTCNRAVLGTDAVTSIVFKMNTAADVDPVMSALELYLPTLVDEDTTGTYTLTDGNSEISADGDTTSLSAVLGGIAGIALLVGGIGIMNIMLVTVTERTREVGIKKAIGAPRREIISQFLLEAAILSGLGGVIGIAVGYAGSLILGKLLYDLIVTPDGIYVAGSFLFSIAIGVIFGLYPAVKASGLQPVDALRAD